MFFFFSKILASLIAPLTWICVFLILALVNRKAEPRRNYLLLSILSLIFFSNTFIFDRFMNAWEVKALPDDKIENFEVAVVLTGMATYDVKMNRLEFNDRTDRLMQTIRLFRTGKVKKIILSGGPSTVSGDDTVETRMIKSYLISMGFSTNDILLEAKSTNTHENAVNVMKIISTIPGTEKILLVSSGWHLRRASACFAKEGMQVIPYSTDRYAGPVKFDIDYLLIPSSETLFNWEKLFHEWVGIVVYAILGYV